MNSEERWVIVEEFPRYAVSDHGRVQNIQSRRILKPVFIGVGYLGVVFYDNYYYKHFYIHRLVGFAFVEGYFEGAEINHLDGDKTNNWFENLEWCSSSKNKLHAFSMGLNRSPIERIKVRCKETGDVFNSMTDAANYFGINRGSVSNVVRGRSKTASGYSFELFG